MVQSFGGCEGELRRSMADVIVKRHARCRRIEGCKLMWGADGM